MIGAQALRQTGGGVCCLVIFDIGSVLWVRLFELKGSCEEPCSLNRLPRSFMISSQLPNADL